MDRPIPAARKYGIASPQDGLSSLFGGIGAGLRPHQRRVHAGGLQKLQNSIQVVIAQLAGTTGARIVEECGLAHRRR
jgi:hypothetical protein